MASPNQLVATINREKPSANHFVKINEDSVALAAKTLTPVEF